MRHPKLVSVILAFVIAGGCSKKQNGIVKPGVGIGSVHAGMTVEQAAATLGRPDRTNHYGAGAEYSRLGLVLVPAEGGVIHRVTIMRPFAGRTKEGVGIGSTRDDVIRAYGEPTAAKTGTSGYESYRYSKLGLVFQFRDGKVDMISVTLLNDHPAPELKDDKAGQTTPQTTVDRVTQWTVGKVNSSLGNVFSPLLASIALLGYEIPTLHSIDQSAGHRAGGRCGSSASTELRSQIEVCTPRTEMVRGWAFSPKFLERSRKVRRVLISKDTRDFLNRPPLSNKFQPLIEALFKQPASQSFAGLLLKVPFQCP